MELLELNNIAFSYEDGTSVFENFSWKFKEGTCTVLRGDNGAGKTTLFRILNGLDFPTEGSYFFQGQEITASYLKNNGNAKRFHKQIGYLFQNPDVMLFHSNVYDEIAFGPRQMGMSEAEVKGRTEDCLKLLGIENLAAKAPYHLSGGQKKKTALAAVLALNPDVLILDEPLAGLDRRTQAWLIAFLKELKKAGKTILAATHSEELERELADTVLVLGEL